MKEENQGNNNLKEDKTKEESPKPPSPVTLNPILIASGLVTPFISATISYPTARILTILQTQHANLQISPEKRYTSAWNVFRRIPNEQGVLSYWRGLLPTILSKQASILLLFPIKDFVRGVFPNQNHDANYKSFVLNNVLSGAAAGAIMSLAIYPLKTSSICLAADVGVSRSNQISTTTTANTTTTTTTTTNSTANNTANTTTNATTNNTTNNTTNATTNNTTNATNSPLSQSGVSRKYNGMWHCLRSTYQTDGFPGLYRGYFLSVFGIIFYRSLYFGLYDSIKPLLKNSTDLSIFQRYLIAQATTITAGALSYPISVIFARRMMMNGVPHEKRIYRAESSLNTIKNMIRMEGIRSLWRGYPFSLFTSVGGAVALTLYDTITTKVKV